MNNPVNTGISTGGPSLHAAVDHLDWPAVVALLKSGQSIDVGDEQGNSPLTVACRSGRIEAVRKLIQFGANVEAANDAGQTPLITAVLAEEAEAVQALLKAGASVTAATGVNAYTVLHWALAKPAHPDKAAAIVQMLLVAGAETNHKSRDGTTPLMHAAWYGSERAASLLLERGADPELGDNQGRKALALAKERGHESVCNLLQAAITAARNRKKEGALRKLVRWWKAEDT